MGRCEVLSAMKKVKWLSRGDLGKVVLVVITRDSSGSSILREVRLDKDSVIMNDRVVLRDRVIPFHRIVKICLGGKLIWEKSMK